MKTDYRFNYRDDDKILSVEIKCCGKHIGEMRFKEGESKTCPHCGAIHSLRMGYNHFHITASHDEDKEVI